ncbi:C3a anaphylatoxin chemotactic receptor-like [Dendropsophus ebraccatus]|uniref:C3a anaphylatoxin chemotactic receptor-like n=1 Tax=Dendropsophus ebraccatus TaxID=150705 RepID=UPI003831E237
MKKSVSAVWFFNLAIADFLCCASLPLRIIKWFAHSSYTLYSLCELSIILFNLNMSTSILLLTAMSIDRCVSVVWLSWAKVHRTYKLVRITVAIIWVACFLLTFLAFYLYPYDFHNLTKKCSIAVSYVTYIFSYTNQTVHLIRLLIMFLIPFLIILVSYVTIFFKLRKSKRPQRSQRPYRIITAVILCFFICWCPYCIWPVTPKYVDKNTQLYIIHVIIINLACLNSCINPIIYVFMGQDVKHGIIRSIPFRITEALSEPPIDLCREQEDVQHVHITSV